jgi:hypothetical protein
MKASLATPAAGSPAPRSAGSAAAPRLAAALGDRAARAGLTGASAPMRSPPPSTLRVQLARSVGRAPRPRQSHPARAYGSEPGAAAIHAAAARGIATPWSTLPHAGRIQRAFGRHDISSIQAHIGATAAASATEMHADAYTTGNHVVLGRTADVATVTHEAAHVIQQRAGVQLKGGVGAAGDRHERHADAVAARVTAGQSAEALLDQYAGQGTGGPQIQRKGNTRIADLDATRPVSGRGQLESWDPAGSTQLHKVWFAALENGCGSAMEAWLYPNDNTQGSTPSVRPSWWNAMMTDPNTNRGWVSNYVVQGHLLNEHLANVEKAAKSIHNRGNILHYSVEVDYSSSPPAAWFGNNIAASYLANFASGITCWLEEFDGTTYNQIGSGAEFEISNAMRGQG